MSKVSKYHASDFCQGCTFALYNKESWDLKKDLLIFEAKILVKIVQMNQGCKKFAVRDKNFFDFFF